MNLSDTEFNEIRRLVKRLCGIWLTDDKEYLIRTRFESVLLHNNLSSFAEFIQAASNPTNLRLHDEIIEAITTKETSFNRDGHPFDEFRRTILPNLIVTRLERQRLAGLPFGKMRIWSAAASTGQEAYSLAIAILEYVETQTSKKTNGFLVNVDNFSIVGTDISTKAIRIAKEGCYHGHELNRGLSIDSKQRYFREHHGKFTIEPEAKNMVEFRRINLVNSFADMNGNDLILCRNLLIYFDEPTRKLVVDQLAASLTPGGLLMLGAAESLSTIPPGLVQEQMGRTIVFRKVSRLPANGG